MMALGLRVLVAEPSLAKCRQTASTLDQRSRQIPGQPAVQADWVTDADGLWAALGNGDYQAVLLSRTLASADSIDLLSELTGRHPTLPVIYVSTASDPTLDVSAMSAGAADFVVLGPGSEALLERSVRFAVRRAGMLQELQRQAAHDAVTGLLNRREYDRLLSRGLKEAAERQQSLAVVLLDIDRFKLINDRHGHFVGDAALRWLADSVLAIVPVGALVARYGGDEFAVLLPNTTAADARHIARQLKSAVAQGDCTVAVGEAAQRVNVTVSAGVASFPDSGTTEAELLQAADAALYAAKDQGRNRTAVAMSTPTVSPVSQGAFL